MIDTTEIGLYGLNKGAAQVWGRNVALAGLQQQMEQERLRKQKEDAEISDQVAKINYDAARTQDLPEILKRYDDIKNTFTKLRGTQNQMERIKLQTELNEKKADISRAVNLSKQAATQLGELGKLRLSKPDELSDDFTGNYTTLNGLSVFDPKFEELANRTADTALAPKFDQIGMAKKLADASVYNIPESEVKSQRLPNGSLSYYTESGKKLDRKALEQNVIGQLSSSKPMQRYLQQTYPNMPLADAVKAYSDDLYEGMRGKYDVMNRAGASVKDDNWREKLYLQDALIRGRQQAKGADDQAAILRQKEINDIWSERNSASGVSNTVDILKGVVQANPAFKGANTNTMFRDTGRWINVSIPERNIEYTTTDPEGNEVKKYRKQDAYNVRIDKNNPQDKVKLSKVLDALKGTKISEDKLQTGNAGGKIKGTIYTEQGKQKPTQAKQSKTVTMVMPNGATGEIPSDQVDAFLKKYPKARRQ